MIPSKTLSLIVVVGCVQLLSGCGQKEAERERARLELEEKTRLETEAGNKAITGLNQRLFGKKQATDGHEPPKTEGKGIIQKSATPQ